MEKLGIAIIGNIITNGSADVFLQKFLKILLPFAQKVYVFSEWSNSLNDNRVKVITPVHSLTRLYAAKNPHLIFRIARYLLAQFINCINLLKLNKHIQIVLTLDTLMVCPFSLAKIMRKKIAPFAAARIPVTVPPKMGGALGTIMIKTAELVRHIVFSLSCLIIVESSSLVNWLNLGKYADKIRIRATFIDTDIFKPTMKLYKRANLIGYIGGLTEIKGVTQFAKSIPLILNKRPDVSILICGDGPCYEKIRFIATQNDYLKKLKLKGWIQHSQIPKYLNQLKLLVLPSETEGLPNIILEAMACGTPVLATPVGAIPDVIKDGETGFLLKSNDPKQIADKIIELLNKPELLEKVSKNAYNYVRENFSYEKTLESWRKILSEFNRV